MLLTVSVTPFLHVPTPGNIITILRDTACSGNIFYQGCWQLSCNLRLQYALVLSRILLCALKRVLIFILYSVIPHSTFYRLPPLNALLQARTEWTWSTKQKKPFQEAKKQIASVKVLTHYDPTLPIKLAADASACEVGAVISQRMPDGTERPIAFASRTLVASKKNYIQLENKALYLVYGVKKFH